MSRYHQVFIYIQVKKLFVIYVTSVSFQWTVSVSACSSSLSGPKVVSKDISVDSIEEVSCVLRRPPVIWDNIHANDYDPQRMFVGPFKNRPTELIPKLRGVLTNPNCEFELNFVAIHTLATWCKSNTGQKDVAMGKLLRMVTLAWLVFWWNLLMTCLSWQSFGMVHMILSKFLSVILILLFYRWRGSWVWLQPQGGFAACPHWMASWVWCGWSTWW